MIPLPTPDTKKMRHLNDRDLVKCSASRNFPITDIVLLPMYLRSKNMESSSTNSRIISFSSSSRFGVSSSSFLSFDLDSSITVFSEALEAAMEFPFRLMESDLLGKPRTQRHRRSM